MPKKTQKTEESRTPRQSQRLRFQSSKRKFRCRSLYLHPPSCCAHLLSFAHIFCTYFAVLIPNWCTIFFCHAVCSFRRFFHGWKLCWSISHCLLLIRVHNDWQMNERWCSMCVQACWDFIEFVCRPPFHVLRRENGETEMEHSQV